MLRNRRVVPSQAPHRTTMDKRQNQLPPTPRYPFLAYWLLILATLFAYFAFFGAPRDETSYAISYSRFKTLVVDKQVYQVTLQGEFIDGTLFDARNLGPKGESSKNFSTRIPAIGDDTLIPSLEAANVEISVESPAQQGTLSRLLIAILPWVVFFVVFLWILQRASKNIGAGMGGSGELKKFLYVREKEAEVPEVTFNDVAGHAHAKREVTELVDYLKNPSKYQSVGAQIPRGVLLVGPPGTGKTLLAKALAGEAGVPFFSISGSEFIEVFVGVGASRVRHLFEAAKKNAPSIMFVDELDSVGRTRGTGLGGGHDEREQTLNQILAEMDGFEKHEAVIVLAATNRPDVLDPALLRPGRFDRHVTLDLPDGRDREAILNVHVKAIPLAGDVDLTKVAALTPGFSGADLKNLVNEAALLAARENQSTVTMQHFDNARDKVTMGTERGLLIQPEERHRLAVHEAGHTVVAYYLPNADNLYKVSIVPRGHALGMTQQMPEHERHTLPEDYLRDRLAVVLGGRAAEKRLLQTVSSGADDDIHQATSLARAMVSRWGMSEKIGPVDLRESESHPFLGREMAQPHHYSEHSAEAVDEAVKQLLLDAEAHATEVINKYRSQLEKLVAALEKNETLNQEQIEACLGGADNKNLRVINSQEE